ncbi:MAG: hypothetical protein MJH11_09845, partial [Lentisphaeria bacterium]|nr:hypothetical protein [Lentisphaeria bacterium]
MSDNKNLKLSDRSYEDVQRDQVKENILDARSTIIGLLIFSLLIVGMILYKVTDNSDNSKLPEKFVFESEPPKEEEVKILEIKKIVPEEKLEEPDEQKEEETPNIQVSTNPVETQKVEVVQTESVEVVTEISTEVTEMDIEETMEEIVETSDIIEHQATPIAVAINK